MEAGAQLLSTRYRQMRRLIADSGLTEQVRTASTAYGILRDGHVHRLRMNSPVDFLRLGALRPWSKAKLLRLVYDTLRHRRLLRWDNLSEAAVIDEESAAEYCLRRFGREVLEYFVDPLCGSTYEQDPEDMSAVSLLFAVRAVAGAGTFNFEQGTNELPRHLMRRVPVTLNAEVTCVEEEAGGVIVQWTDSEGNTNVTRASACIVAVQGPLTAPLVPGLTIDQKEYLRSIRYAPDTHVCFGLSSPPPGPATYLTIPRQEHKDLAALILDHKKAPGRVLPGKGLLTVYFRAAWAQQHQGLQHADIADEALEALGSVLPRLADHVLEHREMTYVHHWEHALLVAPVGWHRRTRQFVDSLEPRSRIQLAGDYFGLSYTNCALASGERAAEHVGALFEPDGDSAL
jgi:oxygen-dependent protoporphyrinogen oxidase